MILIRMSKIFSLKYLLLDLISKKNISSIVKQEISYSLEIKISGSNYLIQYLVLGKNNEITFPIDKFSFYTKDQTSKNIYVENKKYFEEIIKKIIE